MSPAAGSRRIRLAKSWPEFQAIDRLLREADRQALRALSSRVRVTATSFTNHYDWGDFRGDPAELMERWFDMHLYLENWGTHRLSSRIARATSSEFAEHRKGGRLRRRLSATALRSGSARGGQVEGG
ncbi:MAG TPA: hypothetical protein VJ770_29065 [Stellaceae bacterium]|nr:hypothetical protein [Stellaceae bacterium]